MNLIKAISLRWVFLYFASLLLSFNPSHIKKNIEFYYLNLLNLSKFLLESEVITMNLLTASKHLEAIIV